MQQKKVYALRLQNNFKRNIFLAGSSTAEVFISERILLGNDEDRNFSLSDRMKLSKEKLKCNLC